MGALKYRPKVVEVEVMQVVGPQMMSGRTKGGRVAASEHNARVVEWIKTSDGVEWSDHGVNFVEAEFVDGNISDLLAREGDYVVRERDGSFRVIDRHLFHANYEAVES